ncbi:hypothetical protein KGQ20_36745 [Catenulispora sp. NF23]|uniref:NACHT domain-containing protein n=1 Tax=Catenulispora pinistramenti TaxID=2705254 RepID=UPI001BA7431C|nr:hypothetical protein [Catenulispora pinistramenti]MBS2538315.1 hypothetical protein [Catenulispora pinistramenti]
MRRSLRYLDAVKVLAGGENHFIKLLDDASATMLLGAGVFDLFEAREQALRLLGKVLDRFGEKLRGIDRLTRTERIHAAHEVIRITAYFDALADALGEWKVRFSAAEQTALATQASDDNLSWLGVYKELSEGDVDLTPLLYDSSSAQQFSVMSSRISVHICAPAVWDSLSETEQDCLSTLLTVRIPADATVRYQENLRRLSVDCPEFGVWVNLQAHAATREQLATGLAGLETLLAPLAAESAGHQQESLSRAHRADLAKPIILTGRDSHLALPSLGEGYVDHSFRLAFSALPSSKAWCDQPLRHDLPAALGTYLMSEAAQHTPLLILGQPGSGKSVLTRILAARLPADRFLPIRVELRRIDAGADLQEHIESAIREQTGERVQWTRFVTANPDLTPVVILDGFDELLQATGVAQTDFLIRIERFQERELDVGRSVAVIVTSRTAVANRATLPDGIPILRLEPFGEKQIRTWIDIWNRTNGLSLTERGVKPLSETTILRYHELAEQPILLLMLALYDATDNALAAVDPDLSQATVYEQLLKDFARRELAKDPGITDLDRRIEEELLRLSIVAFAMFNRGAQWIDADSLTEDLRALNIWRAERAQSTLRSTLSAGQQMVGRFFFVHDARATRDGGETQTYEFLHATFGEYLTARLVVQLLSDLATQYLASAYAVSRSINDAMLYALLSFESLTVRTPIIEFSGALLAQVDPAVREAIDEILIKLFHNSLAERIDRAYTDYQPRALDAVQRACSWNANLITLLAFAPDGISLRRLYPAECDDDNAVNKWPRLANLWWTNLRYTGWDSLVDTLALERTWLANGRDIVIRIGRPATPATKPDLTWSYHLHDVTWKDGAWLTSHLTRDLQKSADFSSDRRLDLAVRNTLPISAELPTLGHTVYHTGDGRLVTATALLAAALMAPYGNEPADAAILDLLTTLGRLSGYAERGEKELYIKVALGLFITAVELNAVSADTRRALTNLAFPDDLFPVPDPHLDRLRDRLNDLLAQDAPLTEPTPPTPAASPTPEPSPATSSPETPATPPGAP